MVEKEKNKSIFLILKYMDWTAHELQFQDRNAALDYSTMLTKGQAGGRSRRKKRKRKRTKKMK